MARSSTSRSTNPRPRRHSAAPVRRALESQLRVSDAAVHAKTGKTWSAWFSVLDRAGAKAWRHPEIAKWLLREQGLSGWWSQTITVGYEQARLGRDAGQRPDGYSIGVSRTVPVPLAAAFDAWSRPRGRKRWLPDPISITTSSPARWIRARWADGTRVEIAFMDKGAEKCVVGVGHSRLPDAKTAERMKVYWSGVMDRMKTVLTPRTPQRAHTRPAPKP